MKSGATNGTLAETLRDRMRDDILGGHLLPGERLTFAKLGKRYDVGIGVAREALTWLAGRGLVTTVAHHGYQVTPLTHDGLEQLVAARMLIEPAVLAESVGRGDVDWEGRVLSSHHVLSRTPAPAEGSDVDAGWAVAHAVFHEALLSGCENPRLLAIVRGIEEESSLYRWWATADSTYREREQAEHLALRELALARDADRAAAALREHIAHVRDARHDLLTDSRVPEA